MVATLPVPHTSQADTAVTVAVPPGPPAARHPPMVLLREEASVLPTSPLVGTVAAQAEATAAVHSTVQATSQILAAVAAGEHTVAEVAATVVAVEATVVAAEAMVVAQVVAQVVADTVDTAAEEVEGTAAEEVEGTAAVVADTAAAASVVVDTVLAVDWVDTGRVARMLASAGRAESAVAGLVVAVISVANSNFAHLS